MISLSSGKGALPTRLSAFTSRWGVVLPLDGHRKRPNARFYSGSVLAESKVEPKATLPPLSALPTSVLLRSLLVATISSKPYLLLPSLSILSFLCKPSRGPLLNVDRNPILHAILKSTFYKQFCAGETGAETKQTIQRFKDMGFQGTIMTYAKETVFDHRTNTQHGLGVSSEQNTQSTSDYCPHIEAWRKGTVETVHLLGEDDYLAVKLTGAGPLVTTAFAQKSLPPQQMIDALDEICTLCKDRGIRILVDAESQHFQWGIARITLELMAKYNRDGYAIVYNTYQAYLKSTSDTLSKHLTAASERGFTLGLKLVRGAYIATDERELIHDTKENTDKAYDGIAQGALRREIGLVGRDGKDGRPFPSVDLFLASHNRESVLAAHRLHQQRVNAGLPTVTVGFGQLHGMSDEVSFGLLQLKGPDGSPRVYKCSTWGGLGECLAYLLRRAIENRDAVGRTGDEYRALRKEVGRRVRGVFS